LLEEREKRRSAERLAILGTMAASLAHEVRNPVAAIRLHAQLLEDAPAAEGSASRALIASEAERIESLVNQWLRYARPQPPAMAAGDLGTTVEQALARCAAQAAHGRVALSKQIPQGTTFPVKMDRDRILQALINVILNAIQAQPAGGEVTVSLQSKAGNYEVSVDDQGQGFSAAALAKAQEPFYSEKEGGMGLGLAVASEVLLAHGGDLKLENPREGGARVVLRLPAQPLA
jgi:signal transduction histidine kinase